MGGKCTSIESVFRYDILPVSYIEFKSDALDMQLRTFFHSSSS